MPPPNVEPSAGPRAAIPYRHVRSARSSCPPRQRPHRAVAPLVRSLARGLRGRLVWLRFIGRRRGRAADDLGSRRVDGGVAGRRRDARCRRGERGRDGQRDADDDRAPGGPRHRGRRSAPCHGGVLQSAPAPRGRRLGHPGLRDHDLRYVAVRQSDVGRGDDCRLEGQRDSSSRARRRVRESDVRRLQGDVLAVREGLGGRGRGAGPLRSDSAGGTHSIPTTRRLPRTTRIGPPSTPSPFR